MSDWWLLWSFVSLFKRQLAYTGVLRLCFNSLNYVAPVMLYQVIVFLEDPARPTWEGVMYACIMLAGTLASLAFSLQYGFWAQRIGLRAKSVCISGVFEKALQLSLQARQSKDTGEMVINYMALSSSSSSSLFAYLN